MQWFFGDLTFIAGLRGKPHSLHNFIIAINQRTSEGKDTNQKRVSEPHWLIHIIAHIS